jgi:hypothetical protein
MGLKPARFYSYGGEVPFHKAHGKDDAAILAHCNSIRDIYIVKGLECRLWRNYSASTIRYVPLMTATFSAIIPMIISQ